MPKPLEWFDNEVDPLLPTQIKPLLYKFDEYQSYDLVTWSGTSLRLAGSLPSNWAIKSLTWVSYGGRSLPTVLLFERYTPSPFKWCEQYADKIYELVKTYSFTTYYKTSPTSDVREPASYPQYWGDELSLNSIDFGGSFLPENILLRIPGAKSARIYLTWMERDDAPESIDNKYYYREYVKRYIAITTDFLPRTLNFKINKDRFLICSLEVSATHADIEADIRQQFENLNCKTVLYSDLDWQIERVHSHIKSNFPRLPYLVYKIDYTINSNLDAYWDYAHSFDLQRRTTSQNEFKIDKVYYRERPIDNYSACLIRANNDYWKSGTNYPDLGKTPLFDANGDFYLTYPGDGVLNRHGESATHVARLNDSGSRWESYRYNYRELRIKIIKNLLGLSEGFLNSNGYYVNRNNLGLLKGTSGLRYLNLFSLSRQDTYNKKIITYYWELLIEGNDKAYIRNSPDLPFDIIEDNFSLIGEDYYVEEGTYQLIKTKSTQGSEIYHYYESETEIIENTVWYASARQISDAEFIELIDARRYI